MSTVTESDFNSIFHAHKDTVYGFAWRLTGSPETAEDIAQECFVSLWRTPERYDPARGSVRSLLLGMARNLVLKRWRNERRLTQIDDDDSFAAPLIPQDQLATGESVGKAVQALPPFQREVLVLFEYEGMHLEEIARLLNTEVGTVKARLQRARENLRKMLAPMRKSTCNF